jgi:hypothetical protein
MRAVKCAIDVVTGATVGRKGQALAFTLLTSTINTVRADASVNRVTLAAMVSDLELLASQVTSYMEYDTRFRYTPTAGTLRMLEDSLKAIEAKLYMTPRCRSE